MESVSVTMEQDRKELLMTLDSGLEVPTEQIAEICQRHGIQELSIFGSAARTDMRPDSDVDVMVEFLPGTTYGLLEYQSIEDELAAVFHRRIDLGTKRWIKPRLRDEILRESRVIYAA
ncbi:MAG TPA: nucleotidyltransferase family protein [Bryobacteraceae bacterium]|nr:nucleotidyltransferase family protein [Bryobacteraceae bacterium]